MKKIILLIILMNLLGMLYAQQIYINKRISVGTIEQSSKITTNGTYYDLITESNGFGFGLKSVFVRIDSVANIQFQKVHGKNYFNNYSGGNSGINRLRDSSYVFAGSIADSINVDVLLYKLSKDGDSVWTRQYGDTSFQSGWMCKPTRDGGFIITGQTATYNYYGDVLLIKTDSLGNLQWQRHYGGAFYDIGFAVDTCFDGGFIIGGYQNYGTSGSGSFGNIYIIKTDSLGNVQWHKFFGNQYDDGVYAVKSTKDSCFVFAGYLSHYDPYPNCCYSFSKPVILKLDASGNLMWMKEYGPVTFDATLFSLIELDDGNLVGAGEMFDSTVNGGIGGLLIKTNSQGDSIWYRKYANLFNQNSVNVLYDLTSTNDGGIAAFGTLSPAFPDTGGQDVWILKVDSNGCEVSNCLFTSVSSAPVEEKELSVFPNPSENIFQFKLSEEVQEIEILDLLGKIILSSKSKEINLSQSSEGVYLYRVTTGSGKIYFGKLLKE